MIELDARYAQLADANRRKDLDALLALRARDYVADLPDGTQSNYEAAANYSRALFEQVQKIANLSNTILKLKFNGNEATATVFQQFSRTQMKAGAVRNIDTSALQVETWARTRQGVGTSSRFPHSRPQVVCRRQARRSEQTVRSSSAALQPGDRR
jgi:hypothetical protein